jgi:hypothetical protein
MQTRIKLTRLPAPVLEKDCAVCKEQFSIQAEDPDELVVITLPCKHPFHQSCILPWLKQSGTCPVCRYGVPIRMLPSISNTPPVMLLFLSPNTTGQHRQQEEMARPLARPTMLPEGTSRRHQLPAGRVPRKAAFSTPSWGTFVALSPAIQVAVALGDPCLGAGPNASIEWSKASVFM